MPNHKKQHRFAGLGDQRSPKSKEHLLGHHVCVQKESACKAWAYTCVAISVCIFMCPYIYIYTMCVCACSTIFEYHCYVIILFVAASDDQTIKSLQRLGQVRPREDGGSQVYRSDIAGPHVDEERLVGLGPWGWGRQVFELYLNSLQIDSQFFPTS